MKPENRFCFSVCDNCTLTLLARTDELTEILEDGASHIDLSGVPAPWPRLLSFENQSVFLEQRLDDFYLVQSYVDEFDDDVIEKVTFVYSLEMRLLHKSFFVASIQGYPSEQETTKNFHQN